MSGEQKAWVVRDATQAETRQAAATLNLTDFEQEAGGIVARARDKAEAILTTAKDQAAAVKASFGRTAYDEGFAKGHAEGDAEGLRQAAERKDAELARLTEAVGKVIDELSTARAEAIRDADGRLLEFSVALARRIVGRVAVADVETARANLRRALELAADGDAMTVRVNPGQLDALEQDFHHLRRQLGRSGRALLVGDGRITPGGVKIVTGAGEIDATIETQLDRVVEALLPGGRED